MGVAPQLYSSNKSYFFYRTLFQLQRCGKEGLVAFGSVVDQFVLVFNRRHPVSGSMSIPRRVGLDFLISGNFNLMVAK